MSTPLGLMGGSAVGLDAYQLHRHVRLSKIRYCGLRACTARINNQLIFLTGHEGWEKGIELAVVLAFAFVPPRVAQDKGSQGHRTCRIITAEFRLRLCPGQQLRHSVKSNFCLHLIP